MGFLKPAFNQFYSGKRFSSTTTTEINPIVVDRFKEVDPTQMGNTSDIPLSRRLKIIILRQVGSIFCREWHIISQGMDMFQIVTKFIMNQNNQSNSYFFWYIFNIP